MLSEKRQRIIKLIFITFVIMLSGLTPFSSLIKAQDDKIRNKYDIESLNGLRVKLNDVELYFNASNGGGITEYFDLKIDPYRLKNLVNIEWHPYNNLLPLFSSMFYKKSAKIESSSDLHARTLYLNELYSTGGDNNAKLWLVTNTTEYCILQTSSRLMDRYGQSFKDIDGNDILINSTWILKNNGLVTVERTVVVPNYKDIPALWKWYPFYFTRRAGFSGEATFYMFNTSYAYTPIVEIGYFPLFPTDSRRVFGFAVPFNEVEIGGDGGHNILVAYKYDELLDVNEWRSDNYHSITNDVTESGAVTNIFDEDTRLSTHTYHMVVNFSHSHINEENVPSFASYYADDTSITHLMECSVKSNKDIYHIGDQYVFYGRIKSFYNLPDLSVTFTVIKNSDDQVIYERVYGPADIEAGRIYYPLFLRSTVGAGAPYEEYTIMLQAFSSPGIVIASSSKVITVIPEK